jgi:predicted subunit of tRNA(5-methylaminomethyl-2-thiouridylate) methyltransferase
VNALLTELVLLGVLDIVLVVATEGVGPMTYAFEVLRVNEALVDAAANLLLQLRVCTTDIRHVGHELMILTYLSSS